MATTNELNAGFDALHDCVNHLVDQFVPFMFKSQAHGYIESPQGRIAILDGVKQVIAAVDKERAKAATKENK